MLPPQLQYAVPRYAQSGMRNLRSGECSTLNNAAILRVRYACKLPSSCPGSAGQATIRYLGGMRISSVQRHGGAIVTTLAGELIDQATLMGVLNSLYDMGYALLKVERLGPSPPADP